MFSSSSHQGSSAYGEDCGPAPFSTHSATAAAVVNEETEDDAEAQPQPYNPYGTEVLLDPAMTPVSISVHPSVAQACRAGHRGVLGQRPRLDPVTEALAFRAQQASLGEPASPLSPRTLQRLAAALASGYANPFEDANITAKDVLAPVPLAIAWYPRDTEAVHAERKRGFNSIGVTDTYQGDETHQGQYAEPHQKRARFEGDVGYSNGVKSALDAYAGPGVPGTSVSNGCPTANAQTLSARMARKRPRENIAEEEEEWYQ